MKVSYVGVIVGALLFILGVGVDLTVVGLPEGLTLDIIGAVVMLASIGFLPTK